MRDVQRAQFSSEAQTASWFSLLLLNGYAICIAGIDYLADLEWLIRLLLLLSVLGAIAWLVWKNPVRAWLARRDPTDLALSIERAHPDFRTRLVAAIQLGTSKEHRTSDLVGALIDEALAIARAMDLRKIVPRDLPRLWLRRSLALLLWTTCIALWIGPDSLTLLRRAFLSQEAVPRQTKFLKVPGNLEIAKGDDLHMEILAGGVVPDRGILRIKTKSGKRHEFPLLPDKPGSPRFTRRLERMQESVEYRVILGDAESRTFSVQVHPLPTLQSLACTVEPPPYTRLPAEKRALTDLRVLAGTRLVLTAHTNRDTKTVLARLIGGSRDEVVREVPLQPSGKDSMEFTGAIEVPTRGAEGLTLVLQSKEGMQSRGGAIYPLEVRPDEAPQISLLWPDRREELVTLSGTLLLALQAGDDFGLSKVRLHFAVDWKEGAPKSTVDFDLAGETPRELARRFEWRPSKIVPPVKEGQTIDYWLEAIDTNTVTGPGTATVERHQLRIVSETDKKMHLAERLSETIEGLQSVRQGQEEAAKRLGELLFQPAP